MGICLGKVHAGDSRSSTDQQQQQQQQQLLQQQQHPPPPSFGANTVQSSIALTIGSVTSRFSNSIIRSPRAGQQPKDASPRNNKRTGRATSNTSSKEVVGSVSNSVRLVSMDHSSKVANTNSRRSDAEPISKRDDKQVQNGIDALVQDETVRIAFFEYLHRTADKADGPRLDEDHGSMVHVTAAATSTAASSSAAAAAKRHTSDFRQNCVLFWLELHDLMKIPARGTFRALFVRDIYDLYIANGSARQLPILALSDVEEICNLLEKEEIERVILNLNVFLMEAQLVVTSSFEKFVEAYTQELQAEPLKSDKRNVLERLNSVRVLGNDRRTQLKDIINDFQLCRALREFLTSKSSLENLLFVIDALAFEDLANTYLKELGGSLEQNHQDYCICQANKIFNKFLRYGSKAEVGFSAAIKDRILQGIAEPKLRADLFSEAVLVCSGEIVSNHLEAFYKSPQFHKVMEARRQAEAHGDAGDVPFINNNNNSNNHHHHHHHGKHHQPSPSQQGTNAGKNTSSMFEFLTQFRSISDPNGAHNNPNSLNSPSATSIPDVGNFRRTNGLGLGVGPSAGSTNLSMAEILNGIGATYFRDFLRDNDMENTLLFYKEVAQFQLIPHGQKHYILGKARKIFDRYLRRGAKLEVQLPPSIRRDVLFRIADANEATFNEAFRYVVLLWEKKYLELFQQSHHFEDMKTANAASGLGGGPGGAGDGFHQDDRVRLSLSPRSAAAAASGAGAGGNGGAGGGGGGGNGIGDDLRGNGSALADLRTVPLRSFLDSELLRTFFRNFLQKELCVSELHFYLEIVHFQQLPTSDYLTRQAKKMHRRFCDSNSKEFVTLSEDTAREIELRLNQPDFEASPALFKKAQEEILSFFNMTLFPKFQQSEIYRSIRITRDELRIALTNANSVGAPLHKPDGKRTMGQLLASAMGMNANPDGDDNDGAAATSSAAAAAAAAAASGAMSSLSETRNSRSAHSVGRIDETPRPDLTEDDVSVVMILENPTARGMLLFFAEEIFCTENIYFWLDCNEFKDIPHRNYMKLRAQKIFRKYISPQSKMQVNLESSIVKEIVAHMADPTRGLFIPAQKSITKMLEGDTLQKFKASKHFAACLQALRVAQDEEFRKKRGQAKFARSNTLKNGLS